MVEFTFLGTGNAFLPQGRLHSLLCLEDRVLVDCPPTALASLRAAGLSPASIDTVLVTHWHGDHVFGFPFLLLERTWISDRGGEGRLHVHTRRGGGGLLAQLCHLAFPGTLEGPWAERVEVHEAADGPVEGIDGWTFERFEVHHEPLVFPHGYVLTHESGLRIMHTGDTGPSEAVEARLDACDIVVIELGLPDGVPYDKHMQPTDLRALAEAHPTTLFLATHHFVGDPRVEAGAALPELPANVMQVRDGDRFRWHEGDLLLVRDE